MNSVNTKFLVIILYERTNSEEIRSHYLLIYSTRVDQVISALHLNVEPKCLLPIKYWANFGPRLKVAQQNFPFTKRVGRTPSLGKKAVGEEGCTNIFRSQKAPFVTKSAVSPLEGHRGLHGRQTLEFPSQGMLRNTHSTRVEKDMCRRTLPARCSLFSAAPRSLRLGFQCSTHKGRLSQPGLQKLRELPAAAMTCASPAAGK